MSLILDRFFIATFVKTIEDTCKDKLLEFPNSPIETKQVYFDNCMNKSYSLIENFTVIPDIPKISSENLKL